MKKIMRIILPILLIALIVASIGWYLFVYDRGFTRDMLLQQARFNDLHGNARLSSWFYDLAYNYSGRDANVAIELANQYKSSGNYTKAESTLSNAIKQSGTAELYTALSKTYAEQDKLMDSVSLLNKIPDPEIKAQVDALRPAPPQPDREAGFYSQYIDVTLNSEGTIYYSVDGEYPSTATAPFSEPIHLGTGETLIQAIAIAPNGLVSELASLPYTVGGVIEPVELLDPVLDSTVRMLLQKGNTETLYTNDLWQVKEFTVPEGVTKLDELHKIPYLNKLTIHGYHIDDLSFLDGFSKLQILDLSGCSLAPESLSVLATLPELTELHLAETGLSTIAGLSDVTGLTLLDLANNTVRNLEPLTHMPELQELIMNHNALTDLTVLGGLPNLSKLDIAFNSVTSLEPLAGCVRLSSLNASDNQLESLAGIEGLNLMTSLSAGHNSLTDISLVGGLTGLQILDVSNNSITDLSALGTLSQLDTLIFSENQVESLPQWPEGSMLRIIDGSNNQLTSMESLRGMENLAYVYLDYNNLTSVEPINECFRLVQVNVYGNDIDDVTALTEQDVIVNYDPT